MNSQSTKATIGDFRKPMDVVASDRLNAAEKADLLKQWELDARRISVAGEEGMSTQQPSSSSQATLEDVVEAQKALGMHTGAARPDTKG